MFINRFDTAFVGMSFGRFPFRRIRNQSSILLRMLIAPLIVSGLSLTVA